MKHKSVTMLGSRTDFRPLQTVLSDRELVFEATVAKSAVLKSFLEVLADQPSPWKLLTRALRMVALVTDMPKPRSLTRFSENNSILVVVADILPMLESLPKQASSSFLDLSCGASNRATTRERIQCPIF